jgi:sulfonate transport system ATP-binding protein
MSTGESAPDSVLVCDAVRRSFDARDVLTGVDLEVARNEFVCLIGRSGAGKSTLLRIAAGLDERFTGQVDVAKRTGVMFQDARLLPWLRAADNVGLGLPRREGTRLAAEALDEVGLDSRARAWPRELSGGERQRVALARAIVRRPDLLLLDEPFGALDVFTRAGMQDLLAEVVDAHRISVLLVTHDVDEAIKMADRILALDQGAISLNLPVELPRPRMRGAAEFERLRSQLLGSLSPMGTTSTTSPRGEMAR